MTHYDWIRSWHKRGQRNAQSVNHPLPFFAWESSKTTEERWHLEDLSDIGCLVLLGEPGIGKSDELTRFVENFNTTGEDLKLYMDKPIDDFRGIFHRHEFKTWIQSSNRLYLFLDGLDECSDKPVNVGNWIIDQLQQLEPAAISRLYLRITCRTTFWPDTLNNDLKNLWQQSLGFFELAPLETSDIEIALKARSLSSERFLAEVYRVGVYPLAIVPQTLELLIGKFIRENEKLPPSQIQLYESASLDLCVEPNPRRHEKGLIGDLSENNRLDGASQIAAIMLLSEQNAIWKYPRVDPDKPQGSITIDELSSSKGGFGRQFIEEAITTGLFSSRNEKQIGWSHQTFAEFLAARYMTKNLSLLQIKSILFHRVDGMLKPQLSEVAAWLANMNDNVLHLIIDSGEALVLLQSAVVFEKFSSRELILTSILDQLEQNIQVDIGFDWHHKYQRFQYPSLTEQLRPYLLDPSKQVLARYCAIDIVEACEINELESDLLNVVLDTAQPYHVRSNAAYALGRMGSPQIKLELKLFINGVPDDRDDELKGAALTALWPSQISNEEVFGSIKPRKNDHLIGSYHGFLHRLADQIGEMPDLLPALSWVRKYTDEFVSDHRENDLSIATLINVVVLEGWKRLTDDATRNAFVIAALSKVLKMQGLLDDHHYLPLSGDKNPIENFKTDFRENHTKRRLFAYSLLKMAQSENIPLDEVKFSFMTIAFPDDLRWAIEGYNNAKSDVSEQQIFSVLIWLAFNRHDLSHIDTLYDLLHHDELFTSSYLEIYFIQLDSNTADALRKRTQREDDIKQRREANKPKPYDPPPQVHIKDFLDKCETLDATLWWHINQWMMVNPDGTNSMTEYVADLTKMRGWIDADEQTRERILGTGLNYLDKASPNNEEWFGKPINFWPAFAGYRMLYTLRNVPDITNLLGTEVWKKWASIIVAFPIVHVPNASQESHHELVKIAFEIIPDEMIQFLTQLYDMRDDEGREIIFRHNLLEKFSDCWNEQLAKALVEKVRDTSLSNAGFDELLRELLKREVPEAIEIALSKMTSALTNDEGRATAAKFAQMLMASQQTNLSWWSNIWITMQEDSDFGRTVIEGLADNYDLRASPFLTQLSEYDLAELYIWVESQYPHDDDIDFWNDAPPPRYQVTRWRDNLLNILASRNSIEAVTGLQKILNLYPEVANVKRALQRTQRYVRQNWAAYRPEDILNLTRNQDARVIHTATDLLDAIVESLDRLQVRLFAETPEVRIYWDMPVNTDIRRPVNENTFSDHIKRHLEDDLTSRGVILNREVEVRTLLVKGGRKGDRTDIYVAAPQRHDQKPEQNPPVVIVECKGTWNPSLKTAMESQLVGQYLAENKYNCGLYLVGWFNSDHWDNGDSRKKKAAKASKQIQALKDALETQATDLSAGGEFLVKSYVLDAALK